MGRKEYKRTVRLNIARYRKEKNYSQEQLSEMIGKNTEYIAQMEGENSRSFPSSVAMMDIADALEVPLYLLYVREEDLDSTQG